VHWVLRKLPQPIIIFIHLFWLCLGICGESQQTKTYSRYIAPQSGEADRVPDALPHGSFWGRAIQRREGVSD